MNKYTIKGDILPGHGYAGTALYRSANTQAELNKMVKSLKDNGAIYRISVNGISKFESKGSGAKRRWNSTSKRRR